MREQKEVEIETSEGTAKVTLTQLPGMQGGKLFVKLTGLLGPGISSLALALKAKDADAAGVAAGLLADRLSDSQFEAVTLQLLKGSRAAVGEDFVDLDKGGIDRLFEGHSSDLFKLVYESLRENYGSFFDKIEGLIRRTLKDLEIKTPKTPEPEQSKTESSGPVNA